MLALALVLSLTACGGETTPDTSSQGTDSSQSTQDVSSQEVSKPDNGSLTVVTDGLASMGEAAEVLRGGTNQNDARSANAAGIFSSTRAKHPASSSRWASRTSFSASASSLARTVYVPYLLID